MRHILLAFLAIFAFSANPASATDRYVSQEATPDMMMRKPLDGTYKTVTVSSMKECQALCKSEWPTCRGMMGYQPDTSKDFYYCRLNNGRESNSPFKPDPPKSLNINIAVSDLNRYRARFGLSPVTLNQKLIAASDVHSRDMAKNGTSGHAGSDGSQSSDRAERQGYEYALIAENVAAGQKSWDEVFKAWQDSPGHNKNLLLKDATEFGISLIYEPDTGYVTYWTMLMGKPRDW